MYKNTYPGKFIVIDGLDGCGESTQAKLLKEHLEEKGNKVHLTKEPTLSPDTDFTSSIAQEIKDVKDRLRSGEKIDPLYFQGLFAQDRKEHLEEEIIPMLKQGTWVISDRYYYTSFAMGTVHGCNTEDLINLNKDFMVPDCTFYLKVSPKECIRRINQRGGTKYYFEVEERLTKAEKIYEESLKRFSEMISINGGNSIEEVHKEIKSCLNF